MEHAIIGAVGTVIVATRGESGPGEVSLRVGGSTDSYLAWSAQPLARGTEIVVVDKRGPRTVEIESVDVLGAPGASSDPLFEL